MANRWRGQWYIRGGRYKDRWGNIHKEPITLRQRHKGFIIDSKGQWQGIEPTRRHHFGHDPKKAKKPVTFVKPNRLGSLKQRRAHIRRL